MSDFLAVCIIGLSMLGVIGSVSTLSYLGFKAAAEEHTESVKAQALRMTEDCYRALELDITVPFRCAQYMTTGEIK